MFEFRSGGIELHCITSKGQSSHTPQHVIFMPRSINLLKIHSNVIHKYNDVHTPLLAYF